MDILIKYLIKLIKINRINKEYWELEQDELHDFAKEDDEAEVIYQVLNLLLNNMFYL